jgi:hypothetical protein
MLSWYGPLEWYLGCKVVQDLQKDTVTINEARDTMDVLKRFNMQEVKLSFYVSALNE